MVRARDDELTVWAADHQAVLLSTDEPTTTVHHQAEDEVGHPCHGPSRRP